MPDKAIYKYLSPKLMHVTGVWLNPVHQHYCPACNELHAFAVDGPFRNGARWTYNDNADSPTFSPSMNISWDSGEERGEARIQGRCHYFLADGNISYLMDCSHEMAGKIVPLPDIPDKYWHSAGITKPS